jgi:hypothetical protein
MPFHNGQFTAAYNFDVTTIDILGILIIAGSSLLKYIDNIAE